MSDQKCLRCKGTGRVERTGYASPMHMDSGANPETIIESCYLCKGTGTQIPLVEDVIAQRDALRTTVEQQAADIARLQSAYDQLASDYSFDRHQTEDMQAEIAQLRSALEGMVSIFDTVTMRQEKEYREKWLPIAREALNPTTSTEKP